MNPKNPMVALGELRDVVLNSVLVVSPLRADALLQQVGAGLEEADRLRARVAELEKAEESTTKAQRAQRKKK